MCLKSACSLLLALVLVLTTKHLYLLPVVCSTTHGYLSSAPLLMATCRLFYFLTPWVQVLVHFYINDSLHFGGSPFVCFRYIYYFILEAYGVEHKSPYGRRQTALGISKSIYIWKTVHKDVWCLYVIEIIFILKCILFKKAFLKY